MASINFEVTDTNLPLRKLLRQKEETEAEVESLCNMMYLMNKALLKYESSVEYVSRWNYYSSVDEIRTLGNMCSQGDAGNFKLQAPFRRENTGKMNKESTINHFFAKIEKIKLKLSVAQRLLAAKIREREQLKKATTEKFLEEKREEWRAHYPHSRF